MGLQLGEGRTARDLTSQLRHTVRERLLLPVSPDKVSSKTSLPKAIAGVCGKGVRLHLPYPIHPIYNGAFWTCPQHGRL